MKFRKGDQVVVTKGKDKGRKGEIENVFLKSNLVFIPGLNVYKKHQKGQSGQKGGIIEFSRPLSVSSIALVCPNCKVQTRIGLQILKDGTKVRICRKCKRQIEKGGNKRSLMLRNRPVGQ